jgi:hypothetical protein
MPELSFAFLKIKSRKYKGVKILQILSKNYYLNIQTQVEKILLTFENIGFNIMEMRGLKVF